MKDYIEDKEKKKKKAEEAKKMQEEEAQKQQSDQYTKQRPRLQSQKQSFGCSDNKTDKETNQNLQSVNKQIYYILVKIFKGKDKDHELVKLFGDNFIEFILDQLGAGQTMTKRPKMPNQKMASAVDPPGKDQLKYHQVLPVT